MLKATKTLCLFLLRMDNIHLDDSEQVKTQCQCDILSLFVLSEVSVVSRLFIILFGFWGLYVQDIDELLQCVCDARSAQEVQQFGSVLVQHLRLARQRRYDITAEEMKAVMEERDGSVGKVSPSVCLTAYLSVCDHLSFILRQEVVLCVCLFILVRHLHRGSSKLIKISSDTT